MNAECPTTLDLDQGVLFELKGPKGSSIEIVRRVGPETYIKGSYVTPRQTEPDAFSRSYGGYFSMAYFSDGQVSWTSSYTPAPAELLPFKDTNSYTFVYESQSQGRTTGEISVKTKQGEVNVHGCRYNAIEITEKKNFIIASGDAGESTSYRLYIPELAYSAMGRLDEKFDNFSLRKWTDGDPVVLDFK